MMSGDGDSGKNIEKFSKSDRSERRLDSPDAQEAREADQKTISEIGKQNPDNWRSAEGHFAIVDESQVLASRDVTDAKTVDRPVGGYEKETRPDGGITLKGIIPGDAYEPAKLDSIGEVLLSNSQRYLEEQKERAIGATVGTVQSVAEMTMSLVEVAEFVGDVVVGNKERAAEKGAKFGDAIGKTMVSGVNVFKAAHKYLYNVGFDGDYSKPFRDVLAVGMAIDREWSKLPPREQERLKYKLATDVVAGAIPIGGAAKITKAQKLTTALEEAALLGNEVKQGEKASGAISDVLGDLFKPRKVERVGKSAETTETGLASIVDDVERRLAGAGGDWPTINECHSEEVVKQANDLSCTSAVGQMLSNHAVDQQFIMDIIEFPADLDDLAALLEKELNQPWRSISTSKRGLQTLLERGEPFGANLKNLPKNEFERVKLPHSVLVEGLDELGNVMIKDPWDQTAYSMIFEDFYDHWTNLVIYLEW